MNDKPFFLQKPQFQPTSRSWVEFYQHCEIDPEATKAAGHKVYRDVDFALLVSKGGKRKVPKKATDKMKREYPNAWEAYQNRRELQKTHLSLIGLRPSQIKELERMKIDCLETLAASNLTGYFEQYQQLAAAIVNKRLENDKEYETGIESNPRVHQEQQNISRNTGGQQFNIGQIETGAAQTGSRRSAKKENQEENRKEILNLNYSFQL